MRLSKMTSKYLLFIGSHLHVVFSPLDIDNMTLCKHNRKTLDHVGTCFLTQKY